MQYAVIGGINYGYFEKLTPPLTDAFSRLGYMIGVRGSLGSNIFFEPAIEFASYGSVLTITDPIIPISETSPTSSDHKMRSNYIRVPLQVGAKIFDDAPVNIEVRAGLTQSFLVGYTDEINSGTGAPFVKSDISGMRTAGIIGGGIRVFFLKLDVEYEWGLTNFFKNNGNSKLNAFYLILGGNF